MKIYIDGRHYDKSEAKVSVFDHGLLYGDGCFEGIRAYNGRIFRLREHLERLTNSAKAILLELPWSVQELEQIIIDTVRQNELRDAYIRVVVTRGVGDLGLDMRKCKKPSLIVIADKIELYPESVYTRGLDVITSSWRRPGPDMLNPAVKSLNYINNILARAQATRAGAQEAILLNAQGHVAECSGDNIFYYRKGVVVTPPVSSGILEGITRDAVLALLKDRLEVPVREELFTLVQLLGAEEVFLTGTGAEVVPVHSIDGVTIGDGKPGTLTSRLMKAFKEHVRSAGTPVYEKTTAK
jgi:branched-chain amino acid aminotransferase